MVIAHRIMELVPTAWKSWVKIARAQAARQVGILRYSYPALNRLDKQMLELLPRDGTFLEIGANDGYSQSNTYNLEKLRGWRGILIEPLPSLHAVCARHRKLSYTFNFACVGMSGPDTLPLVDRGLMSVGLNLLPENEERERAGDYRTVVEVPTSTLSRLIDMTPFGRLTFVSIDVEGAELHVLSGLDLDRHTPDFLLVETTKRDEVANILSGHMRYVSQLSHHDHLFARVET